MKFKSNYPKEIIILIYGEYLMATFKLKNICMTLVLSITSLSAFDFGGDDRDNSNERGFGNFDSNFFKGFSDLEKSFNARTSEFQKKFDESRKKFDEEQKESRSSLFMDFSDFDKKFDESRKKFDEEQKESRSSFFKGFSDLEKSFNARTSEFQKKFNESRKKFDEERKKNKEDREDRKKPDEFLGNLCSEWELWKKDCKCEIKNIIESFKDTTEGKQKLEDNSADLSEKIEEKLKKFSKKLEKYESEHDSFYKFNFILNLSSSFVKDTSELSDKLMRKKDKLLKISTRKERDKTKLGDTLKLNSMYN